MDNTSYTIRVPKRWARLSLVVVVTALIVAPLTAVATHMGFVDVPETNTHHNDIAWLKDADVTKGCNPPTNNMYCPSDFVTRAQMATFMRNLATNQVVDAAALGGTPADGYAQNLWATVNTDGSLARGAGVVSAQNVGAGGYEVVFDRNVRDCSFVASLGNPGAGTPAPGSIGTARRSGVDNGVFVATYNAADASANRSFHLHVMCGATTIASADQGTSDGTN